MARRSSDVPTVFDGSMTVAYFRQAAKDNCAISARMTAVNRSR
jgi:hypothetical protein